MGWHTPPILPSAEGKITIPFLLHLGWKMAQLVDVLSSKKTIAR